MSLSKLQALEKKKKMDLSTVDEYGSSTLFKNALKVPSFKDGVNVKPHRSKFIPRLLCSASISYLSP